MRALAFLIVVACAPRPHVAPPLIPVPRLAPIAVDELLLFPGETLRWDVRVGGLDLGRAELATEDSEVTSSFKSTQVASLFGGMSHELTTELDSARTRALASSEAFAMHGETTDVAARFDGARLDVDGNVRTLPGGNRALTLHTALAWLRAWARPDATPGFVFVLHLGELYRLDVERPVRDERRGEPALRIAARAGVYGSKDDPVAIVVWLRDAPDRTPLELRLTSGELVVTARLRQ